LLASVICKKLPVDNKYSLRGEALLEALERDRKEGLIPFYVKLFYFLDQIIRIKIF
jgi:hypothetical protein